MRVETYLKLAEQRGLNDLETATYLMDQAQKCESLARSNLYVNWDKKPPQEDSMECRIVAAMIFDDLATMCMTEDLDMRLAQAEALDQAGKMADYIGRYELSAQLKESAADIYHTLDQDFQAGHCLIHAAGALLKAPSEEQNLGRIWNLMDTGRQLVGNKRVFTLPVLRATNDEYVRSMLKRDTKPDDYSQLVA